MPARLNKASSETSGMERIVAADIPFSKICAHSYLQRQLIAYLGNKRKLLPFFARVFAEIADQRETPRFLDPFAGSGSVARLAKLMGFEVAANDWEPYSHVLNTAFVSLDRAELDRLFADRGGINAVLTELNPLHPLRQSGAGSGAAVDDAVGSGARDGAGGYICRHYAPASTAEGDYHLERLFYTQENAVFIDRVRDQIEQWYPAVDVHGQSPEAREKALLVALLLVEASTHANTSGVFKAYHKGFGGHGRDALTRILAPMELEFPVLVDGVAPAQSFMRDAAEFLRGHSGDIIYLDPPYNTHQYGSNYFMLNTIARWDKPPVPDARDEQGRLLAKAGIRRDWTNTRSAYCSPQHATSAFAELLNAADGRHIVLSYNTEGVVPLGELVELLESHGRVQLHAQDYVKYRGGKQSLHRRTRNTEFLLLVTRDERPRPADRVAVSSFVQRRRVEALLAEPHHPDRVDERFVLGVDVRRRPAGRSEVAAPDLALRLEDGHRLALEEPGLEGLSQAQVQDLEARLEYTACRSRHEEVEVLAKVLRTEELSPRARRRMVASLLKALRKFAYRKYEGLFHSSVRELEAATEAWPELFPGLTEGLAALRELVRKRNGGGSGTGEEERAGRDRGSTAS
jgi:adenine-specific DNA-methyltransferase